MIKHILPNLNSYIKLKVKGKHILRFLRVLHESNIELLSVDYPDRNEVLIKLSLNDYKKIGDIKKRYEVEVVRLYGLARLEQLMKINKYILSSLLIVSLIILFLSSLIFNIQVVHSNKDIRELIINELEEKGVKVLRFRKSYSELQLIEEEILKEYRDQIEWLEIERVGTKYIVRIEERKLVGDKEKNNYQHIIAGKGGVIKEIESLRGEIVKNINEYVTRGEVIISGQIKKGEEVIGNVKALGEVYAEVWYTTRVEYPLKYKEEYETKKDKNVFTISFLNYKLSLFDFKPFKAKRVKEKILVSSKLIPLKLSYNHEQELRVVDEVYSKEEALIKAGEAAREKILGQLEDDERIISQKNLKVDVDDNKMIVEIFFSVYEDIAVVEPFIVE